MAAILLAEDDQDIASVLVRLLTRAGHTVTHAADGLAAFEHAVADRPDLVLTDLGMPRMDGNELSRSIRQHPDLAETPIVMLSGHLHPGDAGPYQAGVCEVLLKPCPNDRLRTVIQEWLERGPHAHTGAGAHSPVPV